jgi:TusA-related sulfurtransferase
MAEHHLDCKGLKCPMPIVKISKQMRQMSSGDVLVVEATDPAFRADLDAWVKRFGHELRSVDEGDCIRATLVKA